MATTFHAHRSPVCPDDDRSVSGGGDGTMRTTRVAATLNGTLTLARLTGRKRLGQGQRTCAPCCTLWGSTC